MSEATNIIFRSYADAQNGGYDRPGVIAEKLEVPASRFNLGVKSGKIRTGLYGIVVVLNGQDCAAYVQGQQIKTNEAVVTKALGVTSSKAVKLAKKHNVALHSRVVDGTPCWVADKNDIAHLLTLLQSDNTVNTAPRTDVDTKLEQRVSVLENQMFNLKNSFMAVVEIVKQIQGESAGSKQDVEIVIDEHYVAPQINNYKKHCEVCQEWVFVHEGACAKHIELGKWHTWHRSCASRNIIEAIGD